MPILNYEEKYLKARERLFGDKTISQKNKEYVEGFLEKYQAQGISSARRYIFCAYVIKVLRLTQNIREDMHSREKMNKIYSLIKQTKTKAGKPLAHATYQTLINVGKCLSTWLNDGEVPKGFKDIKVGSPAKRNLTAKDILKWDDVLKMIDTTTDLQWRALIPTADEAGLRPSELVDLEFGDVEIMKNGITAITVRGTKTESSERTRHLYHCVPYLQKWIQQHPVKETHAPLWVMRKKTSEGYKWVNYSYQAMQKKLKYIAEQAGIKKPLCLYNLRHAAITMSKSSGVGDSIAMREFGHKTTRMYSDVYGRLSDTDQLKALQKAYGLVEDKEQQKKPILCGICHNSNEPGSDHCTNCSHPLSVAAVEKLKVKEESNSKRLERMEDAMQAMQFVAKLMEEAAAKGTTPKQIVDKLFS